MKFKVLAVFISLLLSSNFVFGQYAERDWHWEPYATLQKNGATLMVVYYGVLLKGYNGKVRWRILNKSSKSISSVTLFSQKYELKDGSLISKAQVDFKSNLIKIGKSAMTLPISIESKPYKGIKEVKVSMPICTISLGTSSKYEWNRLGRIVLDDF